MKHLLVVVDIQKDFVDGALGTAEAVAIVENAAKKIRKFDGEIFVTYDTHFENYMETQEGHNLPVPHCIRGTEGWQLAPAIAELCEDSCIDKPSFGSVELGQMLKELNGEEPIEKITFVGLCTDICVISNAMIAKAYLPLPTTSVASACSAIC